MRVPRPLLGQILLSRQRATGSTERIEPAILIGMGGASVTDVRIRAAVVEDAPAIAGVHIRGWQWAYRGLLPDAFLEELGTTLDRRAEAWRQAVQRARTTPEHIFVAKSNGTVVGVVSAGPTRDADGDAGVGEVYAIYVELAVVGTGVGRRLFEHATEALRQDRCAEATLWVLADNARARRFYQAAGWRPDGAAKVEERAGFELREIRYRGRLR